MSGTVPPMWKGAMILRALFLFTMVMVSQSRLDSYSSIAVPEAWFLVPQNQNGTESVKTPVT